MFEVSSFTLFVSTAAIFAFTLGPGVIFILTKSLRGGRIEGTTSAIGTAMGGIGHVILVAFGLFTVLAT